MLTGFTLAGWILAPAMFIHKVRSNKSIGERIGDALLKSDYQFRWLENSIPGRIERAISLPSRGKDGG